MDAVGAGAEAAPTKGPVAPTKRVKSPAVIPSTPKLERATAILLDVVDTYAGDPKNPWAIAHGIQARGPDFALTDGRPAVDWLFEAYAFEQDIKGEVLIGFPGKKDGVQVEPHTDLILKALTEAGVSPDREVTVGGNPHTVGALWRHSQATTWIKMTDGSASYDSPNDMPWGMQGLAAWAPPGLRWVAWEGTPMDMDTMARLAVLVLDQETAFMQEAAAAGEAFEKRGQGIFQYTCGGAHLLQGAAYMVARGFGAPAERAVIEAQAQLLFYRFPHEIALYAAALEKHPEAKLVLMAQQLKFVGHWLESVHKLAAMGLLTPTAAQQTAMAEAVTLLIETVETLRRINAFEQLPEIRRENEQLFLDLVGDAAHALGGLRLATGRAALPL